MTPSAVRPQEGIVSAAQRALRVLDVVAAAGDGIAAKAVARRTGYPLATTYDLLNTLVHEGYLVSLGHSRGFGLGYKIGGLFTRLRETVDAGEDARRELAALHAATGAAAQLAVLRAGRPVVTAVAGTELPAQPWEFAGQAHRTAFGTVLLAALGPAERRAQLAGLPDLDDVERAVARAARTGVATESGCFRPATACVAAAVRGGDRKIVAAVAVAVPDDEFPYRRDRLVDAVRRTALRLEQRALSAF